MTDDELNRRITGFLLATAAGALLWALAGLVAWVCWS